MKTLLALFLILTVPVHAQDVPTTSPSKSPEIILPSGLAIALNSAGDSNPTLSFDCYSILYSNASFQNAQSQGSCYTAQTACLRYGLLQQALVPENKQQFLHKFPGTYFSEEQLRTLEAATLQDVKVQLLGCVLAIAASVINDSVIDEAGFLPPTASPAAPAQEVSPPPPTSPSPSSSSLEPLPTENSAGEEEPSELPPRAI